MGAKAPDRWPEGAEGADLPPGPSRCLSTCLYPWHGTSWLLLLPQDEGAPGWTAPDPLYLQEHLGTGQQDHRRRRLCRRLPAVARVSQKCVAIGSNYVEKSWKNQVNIFRNKFFIQLLQFVFDFTSYIKIGVKISCDSPFKQNVEYVKRIFGSKELNCYWDVSCLEVEERKLWLKVTGQFLVPLSC